MVLSEEKEDILKEIEKLATQLGGDYMHQNFINTKGDTAKRIIITYDDQIFKNTT